MPLPVVGAISLQGLEKFTTPWVQICPPQSITFLIRPTLTDIMNAAVLSPMIPARPTLAM
jgi:hypothetical protein